MAVLAKVSTLRERLPSVLVDPFVLCARRAVQEPLDRRAWAYAMLYVNLYGPQLLYSSRKFGQVILTCTVNSVCINSYVYTCIRTQSCILLCVDARDVYYTCTYVHTHTYIHTYIYTYTYIHVHTYTMYVHVFSLCVRDARDVHVFSLCVRDARDVHVF